MPGVLAPATVVLLVLTLLPVLRNKHWVVRSMGFPRRLLELVRSRDPDVLVTLETDDWWQAQLDTLLPQMPHSIKCPQDNLYGMHVYSKLPLDQPEIACLVEPDKSSVHMRVRLRSGHVIQMHCLHPAPPSPSENDSSSKRDAELVVVVARSVGRRFFCWSALRLPLRCSRWNGCGWPAAAAAGSTCCSRSALRSARPASAPCRCRIGRRRRWAC